MENNFYYEFNFQFLFKQIDLLKSQQNSYQYLINEIESLKIQQTKNDENIYELNAFIRNLVSFYENKREPVLVLDKKEKHEKMESIKNDEKIMH